MPFLTINPFHRKARTTQNKNISAWFIALSAIFSASVFANTLTPYRAEYEVSRKGSIQGTALRELTKNADNTYILTYQSDIEWMIFSDERNERSKFKFLNGQAVPLEYAMSRKGTGPDKQYNLVFDQTKTVQLNIVYCYKAKVLFESRLVHSYKLLIVVLKCRSYKQWPKPVLLILF